jgi:UrcA family protein
MNTVNTDHVVVSRPKITLLMLVCGIVSAASIGAVSAATTDDDVPSIAVRYSPQSLATDAGVRALYRRLVTAAAAVCPDSSGHFWVSDAAKQCREQSIARAVHQIDNPRLVELYASSAKRG